MVRKSAIALAAALFCVGTAAWAWKSSPKETAEKALSDAVSAMFADEDGDGRTAVFSMANEWGTPGTGGRSGAIFGQMSVNHVFYRRLTTGDFREDLLVGFDSKANMRFAVVHGGIGDSCPALTGKKFSLKIASRAGNISFDGGQPRPFETEKEKGCFVQIVARSFDLRELLNQSTGLPVFFTLNVDGTDAQVFYKGAGTTKAFRQTAEVLIARQNLSLVNN